MGFLVESCGSSLTSPDIHMVEPAKVRDNLDKVLGSSGCANTDSQCTEELNDPRQYICCHVTVM